ncbi:MAG: ABC transporter permease [Acidobacteria bacterium]|nr:MAG: ABC transporter permease [Acidobacteriota bacterium]
MYADTKCPGKRDRSRRYKGTRPSSSGGAAEFSPWRKPWVNCRAPHPSPLPAGERGDPAWAGWVRALFPRLAPWATVSRPSGPSERNRGPQNRRSSLLRKRRSTRCAMKFWRWRTRRQQRESDLERELRGHLELEAEEQQDAGVSAEEAAYAARRALGNTTQIKEDVRTAWGFQWLETLLQDLRYGLRQLRRNPGFTAVAVLTLALGIGANTAIFSLIDAVMLRTLPVTKPDELMQVQYHDPRWSGQGGNFTNSLWEQVRDQQDVFSGVFAWSQTRFDLAGGGAVHMVNGIWVSGGFFNSLGLHPAAGRLITASDDRRGCPAVAVLGYGFWQDHYGGSSNAIGSTLSLYGHPADVIGVAPPGFFGMDVGEKFDVAVPICAVAIFDRDRGMKSRLDQRSWWWLKIAGRIKPGISQNQISARLAVLSPQIFAAAVPQDWSPNMQKGFTKMGLLAAPAATGTSALRRNFEQPLGILMAVVGLILLIACANIASLLLARAAARHKEIAVRRALGATPRRLVRQLLTECFLLSTAGALLGILFARWCSNLLVRYISTAQNAVFLDLSLDGHVLGFTAATAVLTALLFGVLPAFRSTRLSLTTAMKGGKAVEKEGPVRFRTRKWIVASQVALSLLLLVAAGLLLRSFVKLATLNIGFDRNNVLLASANLSVAKVPTDQQPGMYEAIERRLRALPGVTSVGRSAFTPISGFEWNNVISTEWSKGLTGDNAVADLNSVSPGFFETLRMQLVAGRNFNDGDKKGGPAVAIINQTLARRFFPHLNPLGKTFRGDQISGQPGPPIEVVGVVRDSKYGSLREETPPTVFFPITQERENAGQFEIRTAVPPSALVRSVEAAVAEVNGEVPLEFNTLAQMVNDSIVPERTLALLSGFFGALAVLLAMVGLYGTFSYLVAQRQAEFGIRMALGAQPNSILRLVMGDVIAVLLVGLAGGVALSLGSTHLLHQMLFGVGTRDVMTMAAAAGVLSLAALAACYIPARRAAKVDPMVALRYE